MSALKKHFDRSSSPSSRFYDANIVKETGSSGSFIRASFSAEEKRAIFDKSARQAASKLKSTMSSYKG